MFSKGSASEGDAPQLATLRTTIHRNRACGAILPRALVHYLLGGAQTCPILCSSSLSWLKSTEPLWPGSKELAKAAGTANSLAPIR
jgi:hypothetical protein